MLNISSGPDLSSVLFHHILVLEVSATPRPQLPHTCRSHSSLMSQSYASCLLWGNRGIQCWPKSHEGVCWGSSGDTILTLIITEQRRNQVRTVLSRAGRWRAGRRARSNPCVTTTRQQFCKSPNVPTATSCFPSLPAEGTDFLERGVRATKCVRQCEKLERTGGRGELCVLSWTHRSLSPHCNTPLRWTWVSAVGGAQFVCV